MSDYYLKQYYRAIKNGQIIVGQEMLKNLENLLLDLENPAYYYDVKDADLRISFIEGFCKHTKSPFNGLAFQLELFQKAFIEVLYSFKIREAGLRRFTKAIFLIARKNGKSTLCAALGLAEFVCGNGGTDIICSSNDDAQASIIFDEINNMREQSKAIEKRSHKNLKGIFNLKNKSTIKKLSDRTRNKEGRNIDLAIIDETHEMKDNTIAKSIEQSQSTKDEPLIINITTEGFINDGYLDQELKYAREVLNGEREDETLLVWLYTQDSELEIWQDPKSWQKSNPGLGTIKKTRYLENQLRKARASKSDRLFVLAKDFNIKQNDAAAWLEASAIANDAAFDPEEFKGALAIGAADLSETTDLTAAKVLMMRPDDRKKYVMSMYFIPESKVESGTVEDKKNYLEWAREGYLRITPGNDVDYSEVTNWFVELHEQYDIKAVKGGYDKWNAKYWIKEMEEYGFEFEKVAMDARVLSNPMKRIEADLNSKQVVYNNNPIDKWCLENTAIKMDARGDIMPVKVNDQRNRRIDGALALIIAYAILERYGTAYLLEGIT